jgi:tetratricopeptide (TPR) repeat protein
MTDRAGSHPPERTAAGSDPVSELLYRWDRDRQAGVAVSPEELCRDTPDLLDEVTRRVRALEAMYGVPNRAAETSWPAGPTAAPLRMPGYEVGAELGRGGMGVVWKARDTRLNRAVALKMLPGGAGSSQARARFQVEAEAAAALHHPNIVQVYEVGDAGGCPYLALEYVAGGTLADRLATGPLAFAEAADLAETIARAVDHAHRHGVLHRDLKPANILLSEESKTGGPSPDSAIGTPQFAIPKVADFGLAKRVGSDAGATRTGDVLGTPSYMAPEQAAGRTAEVGVAGDVYGLGGILYACLTGRSPFDAATTLETLDQVVNRDPTPPSRLRPGCPRDLEVITLKCLRKDPGKRYATAAELADDLARWRAGEPITSRPVRLPERMRLWARRRPVLAAMTAALVLGAAASVTGLTALYLEVRHQRDVAEGRRQAAEEAQARAQNSYEAASTTIEFFIQDVFRAARPKQHGGLGQDVTLVRALDAALPRIETVFAGQPAAEENLRDALADVYARAGNARAEVAQLERCVALRRRHPDDPLTLKTQIKLAQALRKVGRVGEAGDLLRQTLRQQTAAGGAESLDAAAAENALGILLFVTARPADAGPLFAHALAVRERHLGADDPTTLESLHNLAMTSIELGRLAEAEPLMRRSIAAHERTAPDHPHRLAALNGLGVLLYRQGRFADAAAQAEALLGLQRAGLGPDHPDTLLTENLLGLSLLALDRPADADGHLRRAYDGTRARSDGDPADVIPPGVNLALALLDHGKAGDAEPLTREVLGVARTASARAPEPLAAALFARGYCLLALGRPAAAVPLVREARAIRAKALPPGDVKRVATDNLLGACLAEVGEVAEAEPLLLDSQRVLADHPGARPRQRADAAGRLARLYEKTGQPEKAAAWRAWRPARQAAFPPDSGPVVPTGSGMSKGVLSPSRQPGR